MNHRRCEAKWFHLLGKRDRQLSAPASFQFYSLFPRNYRSILRNFHVSRGDLPQLLADGKHTAKLRCCDVLSCLQRQKHWNQFAGFFLWPLTHGFSLKTPFHLRGNHLFLVSPCKVQRSYADDEFSLDNIDTSQQSTEWRHSVLEVE